MRCSDCYGGFLLHLILRWNPKYLMAVYTGVAMNRRKMLTLTPAAVLLSACSSEPAAKVATQPAEPVSGLRALYQAFGMARAWAPDVKVLRVSSIQVDQVKPQPGKSGAWQAVFASETKAQKRAYTISVFDVSVTLRKGVFPDSPSQWSDDKRAMPLGAIQIDTDKALETALEHGGNYVKKNPDMPISYYLELDRKTNLPVWHVIWGQSAGSSNFSVLVEAAGGKFLSTQ